MSCVPANKAIVLLTVIISLNNYVAVFAKIKFLKISITAICVFSPDNFSQPSLDRFAPNLARMSLLA